MASCTEDKEYGLSPGFTTESRPSAAPMVPSRPRPDRLPLPTFTQDIRPIPNKQIEEKAPVSSLFIHTSPFLRVLKSTTTREESSKSNFQERGKKKRCPKIHSAENTETPSICITSLRHDPTNPPNQLPPPPGGGRGQILTPEMKKGLAFPFTRTTAWAWTLSACSSAALSRGPSRPARSPATATPGGAAAAVWPARRRAS